MHYVMSNIDSVNITAFKISSDSIFHSWEWYNASNINEYEIFFLQLNSFSNNTL